MTATHTQNIEATVDQVNALHAAGADVVRIAVDSKQDAAALAEIRKQTKANLSVDLQENYRSRNSLHRTSTKSATTPVISITTSAPNRGKTKCDIWWTSPQTTIVPSELG